MKVRYSMREIPKKNYFYLLVLSLITVALTIMFFDLYRNYHNNNKSFISSKLTIVNGNSLKNLLIENSVVFVYVDDINNTDDNKVQEKFYDILKEKDVVKNFVFYDNTNLKNQKFISKKYNIDIKNKKMILIIEDNKLILRQNIKDDFENKFTKIIDSIEVAND